MIFFTVFYAHFVEDKIRQFVDLCSVSNVSSGHCMKPFFCLYGLDKHFFCVCFRADFCVYLIISLLWILHSWPFGSWTCRYKHGGNEQQFEKRSRMYPNRLLVYLSLVFSADLHAFFKFIFLRSHCVLRGVYSPTQKSRPFRCLLPAVWGCSIKKYRNQSAG